MKIKYFNEKGENTATMTFTKAMTEQLRTITDVVEWGRMWATEDATTMRVCINDKCRSGAIVI